MSTRTLDTVVRPLLGVLAIVALSATAGCGGDASDDAGAAANEPAAARSAGGARTTGTLVIGETTYDFTVDDCDIAGEYDSPDGPSTLSGIGELGDGTRFWVSVSRTRASDDTGAQDVTLYNVPGADRFYWSATRLNMGFAWIGTTEGEAAPDEPLVIVAGKTVSAEAMFEDARDLPDGEREAPVMGRLAATCP